MKYLIGRTYESNGVPGMVYGIQEDLTSSKIDKAENRIVLLFTTSTLS